MSAERPLRNRVDPFGELYAVPARGAMMGNRGGKFHRDDQTLGRRHWTNKQWIVCVCEFKNRKRDVWGRYYTELFFLDEATAFAAGHRPCFECRRAEAEAFRSAFSATARISAPEMDERLHRERLADGRKRLHETAIESLPDGAMIAMRGAVFAVKGAFLLPWSFQGYGASIARPASGVVDALTPPSTLEAIRQGYAPRWTPPASA